VTLRLRFLMVLVAVASCAPQVNRITPPAVRCYESLRLPFAFGEAADTIGGFRTVLVLDTVRLDSVRFGATLIVSRNDLQPSSISWRHLRGDTIEVSWFDPFTANDWIVVPGRDSLRGFAKGSTDQLERRSDGVYAPVGYGRRLVAPAVACHEAHAT
jgi:hypothetical protein